MTTIVWFRQDLRLADNPALAWAAARGPVVPVYVLDEVTQRPPGGASRWWLDRSLGALMADLGGLVLRRGDAGAILPELVAETGATGVAWNRCYEPQAIARDTALKAALKAAGTEVATHNASLLHEPWEIATGAGGPYKVFTPFWRAARGRPVPGLLPRPALQLGALPPGDTLADWGLRPAQPDWAAGWTDHWTPGEAGAMARLDAFLADGIGGYGTLRNRPDLPHVSRLSPHLHFGEIGPRQIQARTRQAVAEGAPSGDGDKFLSEIGWREFAHHLLYHFPGMPERNWKPGFDHYPWRDSPGDLARWQRGRTGYPLVDAGMRELWATGYMHNRVRMVVASFLIKHLRIDWRRGEAWFWDTLCDADLANNSASWQWVAGSGADASPYFRIFNPMTQGQKFDPDGAYIRQWCPELARLPDAVLNAPWEAPPEILRAAGVRMGETWPAPIVNHAEARAAALEGYQTVKSAG